MFVGSNPADFNGFLGEKNPKYVDEGVKPTASCGRLTAKPFICE